MFEHTANRILLDEDVAEMVTADSMAQADQGGLKVKCHVKVRIHTNVCLPSVQVLTACVDPVEGVVPFWLLVLCPFRVVEVMRRKMAQDGQDGS